MPNLIKERVFRYFPLVWFFLFGLLLPTQLGKHFWPEFAFVNGVRSDYLAPTFYLTDLLLLFSLFLVNWRTFKPKLSLPIILIGLVLLINLFISPNKLLFLYRLSQYFKIGWIAWIFWQSRPADKNSFLKGSAFGALYTLVLVGLQFVNQGSLQGIWYFLGERSFTLTTPGVATVSLNGQKLIRAYGTFSHPNTLAGFFLILTALFVKHKRFLPLVFTLPLILLSFSKFAIVLLVVLPLSAWLSFQKTCKICLVVKLFLAIWIIWFTFLFEGDPKSLSERLISYRLGLNYLVSHPLGIGLGNYLASRVTANLQPVHNIWILLSLELGLLVWPFVLELFSKIVRRLKQSPEWLLLVVWIFFTTNFDHYWLTQIQTQCLLGVGLGFIFEKGSNQKIRSSV